MRSVPLPLAALLVAASVPASGASGDDFDGILLDVDVAGCVLAPRELALVGGETYRVRVNNPSPDPHVVYVSGLNVQTQPILSGSHEDLRFRTPATPSTFVVECATSEGASRVTAGAILVDGGAPLPKDGFLARLPGGAPAAVLVISTLAIVAIIGVVIIRRRRSS